MSHDESAGHCGKGWDPDQESGGMTGVQAALSLNSAYSGSKSAELTRNLLLNLHHPNIPHRPVVREAVYNRDINSYDT